MRTWKITWIAVWLMVVNLAGQEPAYRHFGLSEGLPCNQIYHITQDSSGLIWIGTRMGLVRFDGERFKVFTMKDGLPDPEVLKIQDDRQGRLWISCFRQKPCYFFKGTFYTEKNDLTLRALNLPEAVDFFSDSLGPVWVSDINTDITKIEGTSTKTYATKKWRYKSIRRIGGQLWVFNPRGIAALSGAESGLISYLFPAPYQGQVTLSIAQIRDYVLLAFNNGLLLLHFENGGFKFIDNLDFHAKNVLADQKGRFWACNPSKGAMCFSDPAFGLGKSKVFLEGKKIINILEDRQGSLWFATQNEGIYVLPQNHALNLTNFQGNALNNLNTMTFQSDRRMLVGDGSGRIFGLSNGSLKLLLTLDAQAGDCNIRQILTIPNGDRWIVSDNALWNWSASGKVKRFSSIEIGAPKSILYHKGKLFFSNSNGFSCFDSQCCNLRQLIPTRTTCQCIDEDQCIWVGATNGLFSSADAYNSNQADSFPMLQKRILDLKAVGKNRLWISTTAFGVLEARTQRGKITHVSQLPALVGCEDQITGIFTSTTGEMWLVGNMGAILTDGKRIIKRFNTHNGIPENEVKSIIQKQDSLWILSSGGLSLLELHLKTPLHPANKTLLCALRYRLDSQEIYEDLTQISATAVHSRSELFLQIPPGAELLEIDFSGTENLFQGNYKYKYESAPILLPWSSLTWANLWDCILQTLVPRPKIALLDKPSQNFGANLNPGAWRVKVYAMAPEGTEYAYPQVFRLYILPFWYQTLWCSLFCAAGLGFIIWRLFKAQKSFHQITTDNTSLQLQAIKARINPHFIGNSIQAIQQFFYPPDPRKASRYIALFTSLLRRTMNYSEADFISLEDELSYQIDFLEMIKLRFGDHFQYEIIGFETIPAQTLFPSMLLQPILENATIHGLSATGASKLRLEYALYGDFLHCTISDNGPGYNAVLERQQASGAVRVSKGLQLIEKKVQTLNLLYQIQMRWQIREIVDPNMGILGTCVTLSFNKEKLNANA